MRVRDEHRLTEDVTIHRVINSASIGCLFAFSLWNVEWCIIAVGHDSHKSPWKSFWGPAAMRGLGAPISADQQKQQHMIVVYNRTGKVVETWGSVVVHSSRRSAGSGEPARS
jgi:hypothetical protein